MARWLRLNARLPKNLWAEAVSYACFKVSKEVWSDKPVDFSILKIFDYFAYFHVQSGERMKLYPKLRKCILFDMETSVKE